jgi:hypothetical protein
MQKFLLFGIIIIGFVMQINTAEVYAASNDIKTKGIGNKILGIDSLNMKVIVPAYFDPSVSNYWNTMFAKAATMPGRLYAIANVNNGPGSQYYSSYADVINKMHNNNGKVIGYVHTSYGNRTLNDVEADIDSWYSFYPSLDGIFIDEEANVAGKESYYSALYDYIKQKDSTSLVVTNPGTNTLESYLFYNGKRIADVICIFESDTGFDSWTPASWCSKYSRNNFYVLPYSTTESQYVSRVNRAASYNIGWIYCTNDGGDNPWDTLPLYFDNFCDYLLTGIYTTTGATAKIQIDGNFNDWVGINSLVPNAYPLDSTYSSDPNANFVNVWAANDTTNLYLSYQVAGSISSTYFYHVFINTNGDTSTGYVYNDSASIGAEFMVENNSLWAYTGTGGTNWSWSSASGFQKANSGGRTEMSIPLTVLFPHGLKNSIKIILETNQASSPYTTMDFAPNNYKSQYYSYQINNITGIKKVGDKNISFYLEQNYPNPFNPSTTIEYQITNYAFVNLKIYDMLGRVVATLVNNEQAPGRYSVRFNSTLNGISLASGIYLYRLQAGNYIATKKMILIK